MKATPNCCARIVSTCQLPLWLKVDGLYRAASFLFQTWSLDKGAQILLIAALRPVEPLPLSRAMPRPTLLSEHSLKSLLQYMHFALAYFPLMLGRSEFHSNQIWSKARCLIVQLCQNPRWVSTMHTFLHEAGYILGVAKEREADLFLKKELWMRLYHRI